MMQETELLKQEPVKRVQAAEFNPIDALKVILQNSRYSNGLRKGLNECVKALVKNSARLCCLAEDCNATGYGTLIKALCNENKVDFYSVPTRKLLGEMAWPSSLDNSSLPSKSVDTSCVVIVDYGVSSPELSKFMDFIKSQ